MCVRVVIGEVADVILMTEANAESQRVIRFPFLTTCCKRAPSKMIPIEIETHTPRVGIAQNNTISYTQKPVT